MHCKFEANILAIKVRDALCSTRLQQPGGNVMSRMLPMSNSRNTTEELLTSVSTALLLSNTLVNTLYCYSISTILYLDVGVQLVCLDGNSSVQKKVREMFL